VIDGYYQAIYETEKKGAIMMGVCRGRMSEGLDFSDNAARMVIIVGIPFPSAYEPKILLKKHYLDSKKATKYAKTTTDITFMNGWDWYNLQGSKAVNQAIGRVIRHVQDYGSILLLDSRYCQDGNRSRVSGWLRDRIRLP
jgi:Rad3-related DNA helicase